MASEVSHRVIRTNGINMHIAEKGSGPVVLLIHGFPELWYSWRHQITALAKAGYHAVAPDMRGYGDTDVPLGFHNYSHLRLVGDLIGLLDALGHDKDEDWRERGSIAKRGHRKGMVIRFSHQKQQAFVVGHDWGSVVASHLCIFRPDRVIALVNLSVPYRPRDPAKSLIEQIRSLLGEGFYICRFQEAGRVEEEFARYDSTEVMKKFLVGTARGGLFSAPTDQGILDVLEAPATLPSWMTEEDIQYFAKMFAKTGFTGGLNYYRVLELDWELLAPWTGAKIRVPTKYIVGDKDLVYKTLGTKNYVHGGGLKENVPFLEEIVVIKDGHHFIQQERPHEISQHILEFFGKFKLPAL